MSNIEQFVGQWVEAQLEEHRIKAILVVVNDERKLLITLRKDMPEEIRQSQGEQPYYMMMIKDESMIVSRGEPVVLGRQTVRRDMFDQFGKFVGIQLIQRLLINSQVEIEWDDYHAVSPSIPSRG